MNEVHAFCRPGFESECGQELVDVAARAEVYGYFRSSHGSGLTSFVASSEDDVERLMTRVNWRDLVFTRDWMRAVATLELPQTDRVGAVVRTLSDIGFDRCCDRVEVIVTEDCQDADVQNFARKWVPPLSRALRGRGWLTPQGVTGSGLRLDLVLSGFNEVRIGLSLPGNRSPFIAGRTRLRMPPEAPSRSTLKLEEAWHLFIGKERWFDLLGGGAKAVDLGAAPGGWTWQLVQQGMRVTAVDNGPMDPALMATGQVTHVQADGYVWKPVRAVDWLVCDIVDKPRRTLHLMLEWLSSRLCRYAIFNLKLPMKQRYAEWCLCRDLLESGLQEAGINARIQARQLYHDREEITCFVERID
ncbi:23S rRNA (cytidine(2498)-2'-O)-methyltransferase RlmM [Mangrovitalea sediminis]|uniref:23S rRNA (cytidine(2498)-2'-O)-methyltransferase RlmM n=1 Tax=Mangrovitalea sediminis TaxID=1982043 RepID=UPI000BE603D5|nr:23S rRNA (cytidine(2498)-2'-O)-methyltransferase RlmM [Mangrovitalea sediminis]